MYKVHPVSRETSHASANVSVPLCTRHWRTSEFKQQTSSPQKTSKRTRWPSTQSTRSDYKHPRTFVFFSRYKTFQKLFHKFQFELLLKKVRCNKWNQWFCLIWSSVLNVDLNGNMFSFFPSIVITSFLSHEVVLCEHCITQFVQTHCSTTPLFLNRSLTFSFFL